MRERGSGILLHITSLPSAYGTGDLGPAAYRFADFLARTGQQYWQILPLNPTDPAADNNPYHSTSAFAFNPQLISPEQLVKDGLLAPEEIGRPGKFPGDRVDFPRAIAVKELILSRAYARFARGGDDPAFAAFCRANAAWLEDFALFSAIRADRNNEPWNRWPEELRRREPAALREEAVRLACGIGEAKFLQYVVGCQWQCLRAYCNDRGIRIIGDMPIYVDYDSADVWSRPGFFRLDEDLCPITVAGVPPDYFSATGQLWHNPVYRWEALERDGFSWWLDRMERNLATLDIVRIDHFRGLMACWEVPAGSDTAMDGAWIPAPGEKLLAALAARFPRLPVIAEDLGVITPDVRRAMQEFSLPGMKVLLFAFEDNFPANEYLPHNAVRNCVMYTGTHDNNPVRGWYETEATAAHRARIRQYTGCEIAAAGMPRAFVRLAMASVADTVIIPLQDLLGLGTEARMNRPGTDHGNWRWRFTEEMLTPALEEEIREMTRVYGRTRDAGSRGIS